MGRGPVGPGRGHGKGILERFYILARFYPAWPASDQDHRPPARTAKPPPPPGIGAVRRARPHPDLATTVATGRTPARDQTRVGGLFTTDPVLKAARSLA